MQRFSASFLFVSFTSFAVALFYFSITVSVYAVGGFPCDNPRLPTEAEVAAGAPAGIKACPNDFKTAIRDDGSAKAFLNSLPKKPLSNCAPPTEENISRLNPSFAICAANFLKAYTERYGAVAITSAYRSPSANACAGGVPGSNHTRGVAMDVNAVPKSMYPVMWKFASDNPQFGVCFPFQDGRTGSIFDRPHMILAGIGGSEGNLCARQGVTRPCEGSNFDPSSIQSVQSYSSAPSSGLSDYIRNSLGLNNTQSFGFGAGQQGQNCTLPDGMVVPCNAIANQGAQQQPTITPLGGAQQGGGGSGGSGQGTKQTIPITGQSADLSGSTKTETTKNETTDTKMDSIVPGKSLTESLLEKLSQTTATSAGTTTRTLTPFEQIVIFARGTTSPATSAVGTTSAPLVLVVDEESAVSIHDESANQIITTHNEQISLSPTPPTAQQTFTSPNLGIFGGESSVPAQATFSPYQRILSDMQRVVLNMLAYLRPFGRPIDDAHENRDGLE